MLHQNTTTRATNFYAPKSPLESAVATLTTAHGTYYAHSICFASPNTRTAKHSVIVTRASDRAVAPASSNLLVKSSGYSSAAGIGAWDSYQEAVQALLEIGVQWFERAQDVAL